MRTVVRWSPDRHTASTGSPLRPTMQRRLTTDVCRETFGRVGRPAHNLSSLAGLAGQPPGDKIPANGRQSTARQTLELMAQHGIDTKTGEIWLAESATPIRPLMALQEFMETFESLGAFRSDVARNPFPTIGFDRTHSIAGQHFSVAGQFSDTRSAHTPSLRIVRFFATRSAWRRKEAGVLLSLRRFFSSNPLMVGQPQRFRSMEKQRAVYDSWLTRIVGQTTHEQEFVWGKLKLINSRNECYHLQFEFLENLPA